jgi:histidinol-phosphate aminotransferase
VAAIKDFAYYEEINGKVVKTRERTTKELSSLGFSLLPSAANFLFTKAPGISGGDFFTRLKEQGILVRHFNRDRINDYLRVSIGTDKEMDVFLTVCKKIIHRRV